LTDLNDRRISRRAAVAASPLPFHIARCGSLVSPVALRARHHARLSASVGDLACIVRNSFADANQRVLIGHHADRVSGAVRCRQAARCARPSRASGLTAILRRPGSAGA
jgi:hypothetical protein